MILLDTNESKGQYKFIGVDTKELFEHNLNTQPKDWLWRETDIVYNLNSQGYRCPEWDKCDWNNSILFIGGSDIFGLAITEEQTVSQRVSKLLDVPTINLGVNAASPMFLWVNTIKLIQQKVSPKAVIYLWPQPTRTLEFTDDTGVNNKKWGIWLNEDGVGKYWCTHPYQGHQFLRYFMMNVPFMWECPCIQYPPIYFDLPWIELTEETKLSFPDNGRDVSPSGMGHPGPLSHESWAHRFVKDLNQLKR